jgi:hypothetical protein
MLALLFDVRFERRFAPLPERVGVLGRWRAG